MFHIDLLLILIDYLLFVIIVDHFFGEHGIKECNVEVRREIEMENHLFLLIIECKLNVHKRCTRNVANDCGLDKRKLAEVLARLNISTEPQKMVKFHIESLQEFISFVFFFFQPNPPSEVDCKEKKLLEEKKKKKRMSMYLI